MGHFYIKRNMSFIGTVRGPLTPDKAVYGGSITSALRLTAYRIPVYA
jgi:hypothetical protein